MNTAFDYAAPCFPNLAGKKPEDTDRYIAQELEVAGIPYRVKAEVDPHPEVHTRIVADLPGFTLVRCWYYWAVRGNVPLKVAVVLNDAAPWRQKEIRVDGHCGCPNPIEGRGVPRGIVEARLGMQYIETWAADQFNALKPGETMTLEHKEIRDNGIFDKTSVLTRGNEPLPWFVELYHVDTQRGLCCLIQALRRHEVIP